MAVSASAGRPPELNKLEISTVICKYFSFSTVNEDSITFLPSYDDRNYYFEARTLAGKNGQFILKVYNPVHSSFSVIEGCNKMIHTLQAAGILQQIPERSRAGPDAIQLKYSNLKLEDNDTNMETVIDSGTNDAGKPFTDDVPCPADFISYVLSILSFVPGEVFDNVDKKYLVPDIFWEIGMKMAVMDKELKVCC